jgi:hypothetical protein
MTEQEDNAVKVDELEVAGILIDRRGKKWSVPAGNVEDLYDLYSSGKCHIPNPDPQFEYQTVRDAPGHVAAAKLRGFDVVYQDEIGIPQIDLDEYGKPVDCVHQVGDSILMKIPKVTWDQYQRAKSRAADAALSSIEPSEEAVRTAAKRGFPVRVDTQRRKDGPVVTNLEE